MNYYLEYIKYLSLKGGKIPVIEDKELIKKYLPLNYGDHTITFNNKEIKKGKESIYNLNSNFEYQENETKDPNIVTNYYLFNNEEIIINEENKIPFETLFLQNSFNIIPNLRQLLIYNFLKPILIDEIKKEDQHLVKQIKDIIDKNNTKFNTICNETKYPSTKNYIYLRKQMKDYININKIISMKISFDDNLKEINKFNSEYSKSKSKCKVKKDFIKPNIELNNIICNMIKFKDIIEKNDYDYTVEEEADNLMKSIDTTFRTYFNINIEKNLYISVSIKANILNKYIFINKFREFLEILYSTSDTDEEITAQILKLYDNENAFVNISDMMSLYDRVISSKTKHTDIEYDNLDVEKTYNVYIKNEIILIKKLKDFIKYCEIIDNTHELKKFLGIKTSLIFFASFIGDHFNKLSVGTMTNSLYPINNDNLICNLLQIDDIKTKFDELNNKEEDKNTIINTLKINKDKIIEINKLIDYINLEIFDIIKEIESDEDDMYDLKNDKIRLENYNNEYKNEIDEIKKTNNANENKLKEYLNYDLFNNNNLPKVFKYNNSTFENNSFPDCVENSLLHFIRAIIWDPTIKDYNSDFLPETSIDELKFFIKHFCEVYKDDPNNENNPDIKIEFNKLIQNIPGYEDIYKQHLFKYEIKSEINIFKKVLNYLFGITDCINYSYLNKYINKITINNDFIDIIYINMSFNIRINIYEDYHAYPSINITDVNILLKYKFINIIYLLSSNYTIHKISKFDIYDIYLNKYIDVDSIIPVYLLFLLFNINVHLLEFDIESINRKSLHDIISSNFKNFDIIFNKIKQYCSNYNIVDNLAQCILDLKLYKLLNGNKEITFTFLKFLSIIDLKFDTRINIILKKKLLEKLGYIYSYDDGYDYYEYYYHNYHFKISFFDYYCILSNNEEIIFFKELLEYYVTEYNYSIKDLLKKRTLYIYNNKTDIQEQGVTFDIYLLYVINNN
jgi:hypothetical protein